ncbi:MAG: hydrogenase [Lentisphaeria bacterium]|nr:hydrogenase [Lentisphaeria bacterium]
MNDWFGIVPALFLLSCLLLATSSRMLHLIRLVALQGILLGVLPLLSEGGHWGIAAVNIIIKGIVLPVLLYMAMKRASVQRELEPLVGYSVSAVLVLLFCGAGFWVAERLPLNSAMGPLAVAAAFTVLLTGLFIVAARKKALTQVIGFLIFENGITLFGIGMMRHHELMVELGILLDVLVLVFIMGIAVCQINREFAHIDADKLQNLDDLPDGEVKK